MQSSKCLVLACMLLGTAALCSAARVLKESDPSTYTSVKGQTPGGYFANVGESQAEARAGSNLAGIQYNGGRTVIAGDAIPGAAASARTAVPTGPTGSHSGIAAEANMNLGTLVMAHTYEGARAVAGTGVAHTAENLGAVAANTATFRPGTVANRGSVAFTDTTPRSAAVSGMGNGPVAVAWGEEVGAMARSSRTRPVGKAKVWDP